MAAAEDGELEAFLTALGATPDRIKAAAAAAMADGVVGDGLAFEPAGQRLLKGFAEPVRVASLSERT